MPDLAGSLGGGGRYDGLIGMFCGEDIPACGFSLGLERILVVMTERGMFPATRAVGRRGRDGHAVRSRKHRRVAAAGARSARRRLARRGVSGADKLGKQFKYAAARGIRFVTVLGTDERAAGQVTIKNLENSEQAAVARDEASRGSAQIALNLGTLNLEP